MRGSQGLQTKLDLNAMLMGSLSGAFLIAFSVSKLLIGSQLGRYPNHWMIGNSALMATLGSLLLLVNHTYIEALAARALMGAGAGNALVSTVRVVSERFPYRFRLMTNISQGLANLTGACRGLVVPLFPKLARIQFSYH
jgi:MFS family permease